MSSEKSKKRLVVEVPSPTYSNASRTRFDASRLSSVLKAGIGHSFPVTCCSSYSACTHVESVSSIERSRYISVSNQIRAFREARDLSLEALATSIGATNQQISLLETGKRRLTVDWLLRLSGALSCHPWALVADDLPEKMRAAELRLLANFRRLTGSQQTALLRLLDTLTSAAQRRKKVQK